MGINRGSFSSVGTLFVPFVFFFYFFFHLFYLEEFRMKMIILIGLFLSVITVEPKSIQRKKAAGNAEQRARQLDQGSATVEDRDENGEEQVLQKMLRIRQAWRAVCNYKRLIRGTDARSPMNATSNTRTSEGYWGHGSTCKKKRKKNFPMLSTIAKVMPANALLVALAGRRTYARSPMNATSNKISRTSAGYWGHGSTCKKNWKKEIPMLNTIAKVMPANAMLVALAGIPESKYSGPPLQGPRL